MRKLYTFLFVLVFASAFLQAVAQHNVFVWNDGYLNVVPSSSIDSVTFSVDNWLFRMKTSSVVGVTTSGFEAAGSVELNENVKGLSEAPTIGVCYSAKHTQPTISDQTVLLSSDYGTQSISVSGLASGTTYYYRVYAMLLGEPYYGNVCSITTLGEKPAPFKVINGHRFVDLDLPSGLLWAETNIGADNPEDAGNYYAWGETETKSTYILKNSKWYGVAHTGNLTATEDAATANWGNGVRMPTDNDFSELLDTANCTWTWTAKNGTKGYKVVSNANGSEIFLPAAGAYGNELYNLGVAGSYWSSTPYSFTGSAYILTFSSAFLRFNLDGRETGYSVRAVAE